MALMAAMMMSVCDSNRSILSSRWKYLRFMSWGIRGPGLISLYFYGESTESGWWWHGSSWNIEQGIEGSTLSLPLTHTVSECGTPTPGVGGAASWRLNMGVGEGVKGFLIAAVESINDSVYYWLRPKCATSSNISRSLTFHLAIILLW